MEQTLTEPERHGIKISEIQRERILRRDGYKCVSCGEEDVSKLIVHLQTPYWRGGDTSNKNLITLCKECIPKRLPDHAKRATISGRVAPKLLEWVDQMIEQGVFRSRGHAVEESLRAYREYITHGEIRKIVP